MMAMFDGRDARRHVSHRQLKLSCWRFLLLLSGIVVVVVARQWLWALKLLHHALKVEIDLGFVSLYPSQFFLNRLYVETV